MSEDDCFWANRDHHEALADITLLEDEPLHLRQRREFADMVMSDKSVPLRKADSYEFHIPGVAEVLAEPIDVASALLVADDDRPLDWEDLL